MDAISEMLTSYAASINYAALPADTVHQAKRRVLDSLGCALAGFDTIPSRIARQVAVTTQSTTPARILGSSAATAPDLAAFANTVMIRYLDCNDSLVSAGGGHPSDMLPAVIAAAEVAHCSGKEVLSALVLAYEVYGRFSEACAIRDRGWDHGIFISLASACAAGRLLGLSHGRLCQAIAVATVASVPLGQTRVGELSMWKGCASAVAVRHGIFSAMLAHNGMEGPASPFEGRAGLFEQVTGVLHLSEFADVSQGVGFKICDTSIKHFPAQIHTQAGAAMALDMRSKVDLNEVKSIRIATYDVAVRNAAGEPQKWDPQTRETADHSLPYVVAVALTDGALTSDSFNEDRVGDPQLRSLMRRVEVSEDPELTQNYPDKQGARMEIQLHSGGRLFAETSYPKGHFKNPLTDRELEAKFQGLTKRVLSDPRQKELMDRIWQFDELDDLDPVFEAAFVGEKGDRERGRAGDKGTRRRGE